MGFSVYNVLVNPVGFTTLGVINGVFLLGLEE